MRGRLIPNGAALMGALLLVACADGVEPRPEGAGSSPATAAGSASASAPAAKDGTPAQIIEAAVQRAKQAGSVKAAMSLTDGEDSEFSEFSDEKSTGVFRWDPITSDPAASDPVPVDAVAADLVVTAPGASEGSRQITVDGVVYLDMGDLWPGEARWAALKPKGRPHSLLRIPVLDTSDVAPYRQVELLLEAPRIKRVGEERVEGRPAVRFTGEVSREASMKAADTDGRISEADLAEALENSRNSTERQFVDVWVDGDGYPVRVDLVFRDSDRELTSSTVFSDYGVKTSIKAPPPDEVMDLEDIGKSPGGDRSRSPG